VRARASAVLLARIGVALALGLIAPYAAGPAPSFARQVSYRAGVSPSSVAIADLTGDGRPELVTADYGEPSRVSVFLNRGDGRFQAKRDYLTARDGLWRPRTRGDGSSCCRTIHELRFARNALAAPG
jgi:hypothetical protein